MAVIIGRVRSYLSGGSAIGTVRIIPATTTAVFTVTHSSATDRFTVNQDNILNGWRPLGSFYFEEKAPASISLSGAAASDRSNTNRIRLRFFKKLSSGLDATNHWRTELVL